jgi:hypothetical protein
VHWVAVAHSSVSAITSYRIRRYAAHGSIGHSEDGGWADRGKARQ